jgi:putative membrane protein insertion efficiency factor
MTPTPSARVALVVVRAYQLLLAPFAGGACRFEPSCSAYAIEAIERHGAWTGAWLALRRVARCHPFSRAGFDPVPTHRRS